MTYKEFTIPSSNGKQDLFCWVLEPQGPPERIIQLVHGLGCHSGRYRYMAQKLCGAGALVCANDHVGHGRTALPGGTFGRTFGDWRVFPEDEHRLHQAVARQYPQLPFGMFGHSMGSMIARSYAAMYPEDGLKALALGGVCQQNPGADILLTRPEIPDLMEQGHGHDLDLGGKYFDILMEKANIRFPGEDASAWLCRDLSVRTDYAADPLNNHTGNSLEMLFAFLELYRTTTDPANDARIPQEVPLLLMAGDQDPCSNYGEGLYNAANSLIDTGHRVGCMAFSGYRHEIHNHPALRDRIIGELICFFHENM